MKQEIYVYLVRSGKEEREGEGGDLLLFHPMIRRTDECHFLQQDYQQSSHAPHKLFNKQTIIAACILNTDVKEPFQRFFCG